MTYFKVISIENRKQLLCPLLLLTGIIVFGIEECLNLNKIVFKPPPVGKGGPKLVTVFCKGYRRLGNLMFNYASLLGIAKSNNMTPVFPKSIILREVFESPMKKGYFDDNFGMWHSYAESRSGAYDKSTKNLPNFNMVLSGYYQSWKYFNNVKDDVRKHFKFKTEISDAAAKYLDSLLSVNKHTSKVVRVGVHVRRGDMTYQHIIKQGYVTPNASWIKHAMDFFRKQYTNPVFVVCSDDIYWCKNNIHGKDVVFSESGDLKVDLSILTQCHHTVMTVGSFSWWAAWLTNGTTVYYKDWPQPNSALATKIEKKDYYMPNWIPM